MTPRRAHGRRARQRGRARDGRADVPGHGGVLALPGRPRGRGDEPDPEGRLFRKPIETPWATTTVCSGDLATEVSALKAQDGDPIMAHGGVRLAQALVRADLVDEYHLLISPVAHGGGSPLFTELTKLKLVEVKSFPRGNLALTYTRPDVPAS